MPYIVDFKDVSTAGPGNVAGCGRPRRAARQRGPLLQQQVRARVHRQPGRRGPRTWWTRVSRILKDERGIVIGSTPLEATTFEVDGHPHGLTSSTSRGCPSTSSTRSPTAASGPSASSSPTAWTCRRSSRPVQVRPAEVEAGGDNPRVVLRDQGRVLRISRPCDLSAARSSATAPASISNTSHRLELGRAVQALNVVATQT